MLYDEIAEILASTVGPLPDFDASGEATPRTVAALVNLQAFTLREANAMHAVVLRLAREIDALRNA
ncbi:MAG: hypothetical protein ABSA40_00760 [Candidatus Dormibacteria bacterium]